MMSDTIEPQPRVLLAYHYFPHYRAAVLRELVNSPTFHWTLGCGVTTYRESLRMLSHEELRELWKEGTGSVVEFRNWWIRGPVLWQRGLLREVCFGKYEKVVLLGGYVIISYWLAAIICRLRGIRVYFWTHGLYRHETGLKAWMRRRFYHLAHVMLLYGSRARDLLVEEGFDPETCYVVYNSLDYDKQKQVAETITRDQLESLRLSLFGDRSSLPVLIFAGRLTAQKQLSMIVDAVRICRERGHDMNAVFVGEGSQKPALEEQVSRAGLESCFRFEPACYDESILGPLLAMADVCVAPGEVGLTAMHCMAYGTPVITHGNMSTQMPEVEAVVPGRTGEFFEEGSADDLADTILRWLNDHDRPDAVGRSCQAEIESHFRPAVQREIIEAALRGVPATQAPAQKPIKGTTA